MGKYDFAILGAGAIGSILGAHLARAGRSVVMLARERRAAEIERDGLRIRGLVDLSVPARVLRDPSHLSAAEVLIVAMKTPGTREALQPLRGSDISVAFSIQNGPGKNDTLAEIFGRERVLGAVADTSGERHAGGEVLFTRNVNIQLGELTGRASTRARRIAETIDDSGIRAAAADNIASLEWSKFCGWAGLMAMSVTTRALTWQFLADSESAQLVCRLIRELGSLALALGIELVDSTVLPVASICSATERQAVQEVMKMGLQFRASAPRHRMSSLQDLLAGRPLEIEETLGYAHRKALELGLTLPLLEVFYHLAGAIDHVGRNSTVD